MATSGELEVHDIGQPVGGSGPVVMVVAVNVPCSPNGIESVEGDSVSDVRSAT